MEVRRLGAESGEVASTRLVEDASEMVVAERASECARDTRNPRGSVPTSRSRSRGGNGSGPTSREAGAVSGSSLACVVVSRLSDFSDDSGWRLSISTAKLSKSLRAACRGAANQRDQRENSLITRPA